MNKSTDILLDTHIWIWLINGDTNLTPIMRKMINQAAKLNNLYLSVISVWEVAMLETKGRITFGKPCLDWVTKALANIQLISLTPQIAIESCQLPGSFHDDPADRMIAATARIEDLTLVTRDTRILQYGKSHYIKTLKA